MFGILATMFLGTYAAGSSMSDLYRTKEKKNESVKNGEAYYFDSHGKMRSVKTNEICMIDYVGVNHHGHTVLTGCTTGRVYYDYTVEKANKANEEAKANGKKFVYKEYLNVHPKGKGGNSYGSTFWPYDPEKKMRYKLELNPYSTTMGNPEQYYKKIYYKEPNPNKDYVLDDIAEIEYLSMEEGKDWWHGAGAYRRFS